MKYIAEKVEELDDKVDKIKDKIDNSKQSNDQIGGKRTNNELTRN